MPVGIPIAIGFYPGSASPVDERYLNDGVPYANTTEVLASIPSISRHIGLTVNVAGVEYWFWPDVNTLVNKVGTLVLADGSVTNAKLVNMAGYTVKGKRSGTGAPEDISLAQLRTDLNIPTDPTSAIDNKVDKITDYTLLSPIQAAIIANQSNVNTGDETESTILAKLGVDSVVSITELAAAVTGLQPSETGKGLSTNDYTTDEKTKLAAITPPEKLHFGAYASVSDRITNAVEGIDYPTGWVLSVSSPGGLQIVHNLGVDVSDVKVWSIDTNGKRQEQRAAAFTGLLCPDLNTLVIEGLATVEKEIDIYIQFV